MNSNLKTVVLYLAKYTGAFHLARRATRNAIRILCYHGLSLKDEHVFRGRLFMHPETFRERLRLLKKHGYNVLYLHQAMEALEKGNLPDHTTVITFDDGWHGIYKHGLPALRDVGFPATIYITSYYCEKETQVFNVAVQYLFWRSPADSIDLSELSPELGGNFDLHQPQKRQQATDTIIQFGNTQCDATARQNLLRSLGRTLQLDPQSLEKSGCFRLMTLADIKDAADSGIDIQLHTHRHSLFDMGPDAVSHEIDDNRRALSAVIANKLTHFCYPSGLYTPEIWPVLQGMDIETATTCESGFNYPHTPRLALKRILDEEFLSQIEFEAELSGFLEVCRRALNSVRRKRKVQNIKHSLVKLLRQG